MGALQYIKETRGEMKHVTWPSRAQVVSYTVAVIAISIITSLYLGFFDFLFQRSLQTLLYGRAEAPSETLPNPFEGFESGNSTVPIEDGSTGVDASVVIPGIGESGE